MRGLIAGCLFMATVCGTAVAQTCDEDSIASVSKDGSIVVLQSGKVFKVDDFGDQANAASWVAEEDVLNCDDTSLVNKDEDGEKISVIRLK
jgi:hypothetical protein